MNTRDRKAWAKHLGAHLLPSPTGESNRIVIPGRGPSKANTYEIHFDPDLWNIIRPLVEQWRAKTRKRPYWISPSYVVKAYEELVAYHVTASERFTFDGPLALEIAVYGSRLDLDNQIKAIQDGVQQSGLVANDNQFTKLDVEKFAAREPRVELQIRRR
jgi:Holliday junction resolvase RusA-like endonuclease